MNTQQEDTAKRALGDANGRFTVDQLNDDDMRALADHVWRKFDDKKLNGDSAYMITDGITGEQYAIGAATNRVYNPDIGIVTVDIDFVAAQFEAGKIIKPDQNIFQKLGGADVDIKPIKGAAVTFKDESGNKFTARQFAADSIHPKVLASIVSAEQNKHIPTYNPDAPDARAKIRTQNALSEALQERRERLYEVIRTENKTNDSAAKSELYRVSIEPESFTLSESGGLVGHKENERIFNSKYAALPKGSSADLGDTNNQYLITKPNDSIVSFIKERADLDDGNAFINATAITKKGDNATTFIYAVTDKENNSGRFKAVRIDDEGMVLADGRKAFASVGINASRLNQGSKWGNTEDGDATSSELNQAKFFNQVSPNNLRQMISQTQIREYQKNIGNDIAYSGFDSDLLEIPEITATQEARYKEAGPRGLLIDDDIGKAIAKATFTDRHEVITLNQQQIKDLKVYAGDNITSDRRDIRELEVYRGDREYSESDEVYNYEIASAVMLVDHHADNSHESEPGVARRSRIISQTKIEDDKDYEHEPTKASIKYDSHNFKDGEYISSNYPLADKRHSLDIKKAIGADLHAENDDKYENMKLLSSSAVADAAINSINNGVRYSENSQLMKGEPGVSDRHEVMAHIDQIKAASAGKPLQIESGKTQELAATPRRNKM